jgi:GTPase SAR1 family protein
MYYRDADGAVLVFDVTRRETFESLKDFWIKELLEKGPENIQIAIVGNKSDITEKEVVTMRETQDFAMHHKATYKFVSAKKNQNLNDVFQKLGEKMRT